MQTMQSEAFQQFSQLLTTRSPLLHGLVNMKTRAAKPAQVRALPCFSLHHCLRKGGVRAAIRGEGLPALHIPLNFRIASCQFWNLIVCARNSAMLEAVLEWKEKHYATERYVLLSCIPVAITSRRGPPHQPISILLGVFFIARLRQCW